MDQADVTKHKRRRVEEEGCSNPSALLLPKNRWFMIAWKLKKKKNCGACCYFCFLSAETQIRSQCSIQIFLCLNCFIISIVFDLGVDPEGMKVSYSISGPYFSVERDSGIVKLIKELDRETLNELETIITITGVGLRNHV